MAAVHSAYQLQIREHFLAAPVTAAPDPWQPVGAQCIPVGGLLGIGFGVDPVGGHDLLMVVSSSGHGILDASSGVRLARDPDPDPDPDISTPTGPELSCPGLGPLRETAVRIAGLFGGGLHTTTDDGWTVDVVSPDWPHHRVILSADGGLCRGPAGGTWWHILHAHYSELRAAGFSPSGRTLAVATSSDVTLWTRSVPGVVA